MTGDAGTEKPAYRAGFFVSGILWEGTMNDDSPDSDLSSTKFE
jgi:hypothetical protein